MTVLARRIFICCSEARSPFPCDPKLIQSIGGEIVPSGYALRQSHRCALFATSMAHCETEYCLRMKRAFPPVT